LELASGAALIVAAHLLYEAWRPAMKVLATAVFSLFLVAGMVNAQSDFEAGQYTITGSVLSPNFSHNVEVEIRLLTDTEVPVATERARTQEQFRFRGLPKGIYYVEVEAPGLKTTRQRVDFIGSQREVNITLMPESLAQYVFRDSSDYAGENDVIDIKDVGRSPQVLKQFNEALKKLQKGDVHSASSRLESLLVSDPNFYDAHKTLGIAYQQIGRYSDAETQFRLAHNLRPKSTSPLVHLGSLYLEQAEGGKNPDTPQQEILEKARDVLQKSIGLNSGDAFARYLLGVAYYRLGAYGDAENILTRALDLDPLISDIRLALANVYIRTQDWSKALGQLDTYLKDNPRSANRENVLSTRTKVAEIAGRVKNQSPGSGSGK